VVQLQADPRGLGTQQRQAWLSKGLIAGRWLRLIPCSLPIWLILLLRMTLLGRPFCGSVRVSNPPRARRLGTVQVVSLCSPACSTQFSG